MKELATWVVTFALALGAAALLFDPAENFMAFAAVAIAMTSTALSTLIGIMKERGLEGTADFDAALRADFWSMPAEARSRMLDLLGTSGCETRQWWEELLGVVR